MKQLIVSPQRNGSEKSVPMWDYVLCGQRGEMLMQGCAELELLPAGMRHTVLALPVGAYSVHPVQLPRIRRAQIRLALHGCMEEVLLDEPQTLHLALLPNLEEASRKVRQGEKVLVLACDKTWLQHVVGQLRASGRPISRIIVDAAEAAQAAAARHPAQQRWEQLLAAHAQAQSVQMDLAQFEFDVGVTPLAKLKNWGEDLWRSAHYRSARVAALLLVVAHLVGLNVWAWRERQALNAKAAQMQQILLQTFAQTTLVIDPLRQMQRGVAALRGGVDADAQDLETLLRRQEVTSPGSVEYANGQLQVKP